MTWFGWCWRGNRWQRVCDGDSIGDVARQLDVLAKGVPTYRQCITSGAAPTFSVKEDRS